MGFMDLMDGVGYVMDTPRALTHGAIAKVADAIRGKKVRDNWRESGRGMLESLGVVGKNQDGLDMGDAAGFAAEMALDPLNLVGGGIAAKLLLGSKRAKNVEKVGKAITAVHPETTPALYNRAIQATLDGTRSVMPSDVVHMAEVVEPLKLGYTPAKKIQQAVAKKAWERPDIAPGDPLLYSRLERAAEWLPGQKFKPQSVINQLKKYPEGVSQEEIDYTKLADFLQGKKMVDKQELVDYVKANRPKIKVEYGGGEYLPYVQGRQYDGSFDGSEFLPDYKETLLSLDRGPNAEPLYRSEHFPGKSDVIAHGRSTVRDTPGGKTYLAEEQQSDWAQDAEKYGVHGEPADRKARWKSSGTVDGSPQRQTSAYGTIVKGDIGSYDLSGVSDRSIAASGSIGENVFGSGMKTMARITKDGDSYVANLGGGRGTVRASTLADLESNLNQLDNKWRPYSISSGSSAPEYFDAADDAKRAVFDAFDRDLGTFRDDRPARPLMRDSWPDLVLKQQLLEAAQNPKVKYFGLPSGSDVKAVVGGELSGQQQFYDVDQVKRLDKLLKTLGGGVVNPGDDAALMAMANSDADRVLKIHPYLSDDSLVKQSRAYDILDSITDRKYGAQDRLFPGIERGNMDQMVDPEMVRKVLMERAPSVMREQSGVSRRAEITPEMRRQILTKGFPIMSLMAALLGPSMVNDEGA